MAVQMELTRIIINETSDSHIIFLKEVDGERMFPIVIGIFEASSIDRRVRNQATPRPLTHDLLANTIDLLGGDLQDIYINELREHTYFAKLRIRHEGELVEVDSRPSDAIALAVTVDVPIFVADDILDEVGQSVDVPEIASCDRVRRLARRFRRRGARVVDWDGLENRSRCKPTVGSNPTPSALPRRHDPGQRVRVSLPVVPPRSQDHVDSRLLATISSLATTHESCRRGGMADAEDLKSSGG